MEPIYYTVASSSETISGISTITLEENLNNDIGAGHNCLLPSTE